MSNTSQTFYPAIQGRAIIKTATVTETAQNTVSNIHSGWTDIGLSITYTPSNANSILFIFGTLALGISAGAPTSIRLDRDGNLLPVNDASATPMAGLALRDGSAQLFQSITFMQTTASSSTSSTTIKVQVRANTGSSTTGTFNGEDSAFDTNANTNGRYVSTINIWEIL